MCPTHVPCIEVAVVVNINEVVVAVADASKCPLLAEGVAVVCAHGLKCHLTLVEVEPSGDFVLLTVTANEDVGQTVVVDIGNIGC